MLMFPLWLCHNAHTLFCMTFILILRSGLQIRSAYTLHSLFSSLPSPLFPLSLLTSTCTSLRVPSCPSSGLLLLTGGRHVPKHQCPAVGTLSLLVSAHNAYADSRRLVSKTVIWFGNASSKQVSNFTFLKFHRKNSWPNQGAAHIIDDILRGKENWESLFFPWAVKWGSAWVTGSSWKQSVFKS